MFPLLLIMVYVVSHVLKYIINNFPEIAIHFNSWHEVSNQYLHETVENVSHCSIEHSSSHGNTAYSEGSPNCSFLFCIYCRFTGIFLMVKITNYGNRQKCLSPTS